MDEHQWRSCSVFYVTGHRPRQWRLDTLSRTVVPLSTAQGVDGIMINGRRAASAGCVSEREQRVNVSLKNRLIFPGYGASCYLGPKSFLCNPVLNI